MHHAMPDVATSLLTRRHFLKLGAAVATASIAGSFGWPFEAYAATTPQDDAFLKTSAFLTGHKLNATTASRFLAALNQSDASFATRLVALQAAIQQSSATSMDDFLAQTGHQAEVLATAKEIVSAWYLGVVGQGKNAVLISFYDALMFEPTRDSTYVPSYGGGPDSWVPTPPFRFPVEKQHA